MRKGFCPRVQVKLGPGGRWLAYTLQSGGSEECKGRVVDLNSKRQVEAGELTSVHSLEWLQEGTALVYTVPDASGRPHKVTPCSSWKDELPPTLSSICRCSAMAGIQLILNSSRRPSIPTGDVLSIDEPCW